MPSQDMLDIEILADGTIKVSSDEISGPNHLNAEQFLKFLSQKLGGQVDRTRKTQGQHQHRQQIKA